MTDECISPLRQRMIEDMSLRHFGEKTQKDYIRAVKNPHDLPWPIAPPWPGRHRNSRTPRTRHR